MRDVTEIEFYVMSDLINKTIITQWWMEYYVFSFSVHEVLNIEHKQKCMTTNIFYIFYKYNCENCLNIAVIFWQHDLTSITIDNYNVEVFQL